jgi:HEAT repeat protein
MLVTDLEQIVAELRSPVEEGRRLAVVALSRQPLDVAMPLLFTAMGDESWRVRKEAVAVLMAAKPASAAAVDGLIELLRSSDNAGLRNSAVESLERLGVDAVEALCRHLDDPDHDLRKFIIDILGTIRCTSCVPLLVKALDDLDANVRVAAAENLGKLGDPVALPHLLKVLDGGDVWLKFTVLDALGLIGVPVPLASFVPLLQESLLKRAIYDCLGALGGADCVPVLLEGVQERVKNAREAAVVALMRVRGRLPAAERAAAVDLHLKELKGTKGAERLISSLGTADAGHIEAVVEAAGLVGDEQATKGLLGVAREERFRKASLAAFRAIGAAAVPELVALFPVPDAGNRPLVALLLGELGCSECAELLAGALDDESHEVRAACASALGKLAPQGMSARLAALLDDPQPQVCDAALQALHALTVSDPAGVASVVSKLVLSPLASRRRQAALLLSALSDGDSLSRLVKDEDASVRKAAVGSLAAIRLPQTVGQLAMALSDEEPDVRVAAAQGLSDIGDADVLEPLLLALNDQDPWVQIASLKGLSSVGDRAALPAVKALLPAAHGPVLISGLSALAAIGGSGELAPVEAALADGDEEVVEAAIAIMSSFGGDWVDQHFPALVNHRHWGVRRAVVRALGELPGDKALPLLNHALSVESDLLVKDEIATVMNRFK